LTDLPESMAALIFDLLAVLLSTIGHTDGQREYYYTNIVLCI